jgi:predicted PurR-regulated permease PerM
MKSILDYHLIAYCIYLPLMLLLTWYVAGTLFKSGKTFMLEIFHNKEDIANATNKLFKTGFYLLNLGFGFMILEIGRHLDDARQMIEALSPKVGGFSIYLGFMLFFNLYFFFRGRKISRQRSKATLPVIDTKAPEA